MLILFERIRSKGLRYKITVRVLNLSADLFSDLYKIRLTVKYKILAVFPSSSLHLVPITTTNPVQVAMLGFILSCNRETISSLHLRAAFLLVKVLLLATISIKSSHNLIRHDSQLFDMLDLIKLRFSLSKTLNYTNLTNMFIILLSFVRERVCGRKSCNFL